MNGYRCPHCGTPVQDALPAEGRLRFCPACGEALPEAPVPPDALIIDVKPTSTGGDVIDEDPEVIDPFFGSDARRPGQPAYQESYSVLVQRRFRGGNGCCGCGCFVIALIFALALQGLFSLI